MASILWHRDAIAEMKAAPQTLSSWNNCMAKAYCKWPAIGAFVIASVIIISIIWCLARCLCCGASCCCNCCPGGRNKGPKHVDHSPFPPSPYHGYQATPSPSHETPQYAQFDVSRGAKPHGDALPAMPTWEKAKHRKIQDHDDDLEMGYANHNAGQRVPMLSGAASPLDGYHRTKEPTVPSQQFRDGHLGGDLGVTSYSNRPQYIPYSPLEGAGPEKSKPVGVSRKEI